MGTRADFYIGRGEQAEWLGSIAWDGYPSGIPEMILKARNRAVFRAEVEAFIASREDGTRPDMGWPWPWDDSRTTDYAYAYDTGEMVWASGFGSNWFDPNEPEPETDDGDRLRDGTTVFPNMKDKQSVTLGKRSGVIVIG